MKTILIAAVLFTGIYAIAQNEKGTYLTVMLNTSGTKYKVVGDGANNDIKPGRICLSAGITKVFPLTTTFRFNTGAFILHQSGKFVSEGAFASTTTKNRTFSLNVPINFQVQLSKKLIIGFGVFGRVGLFGSYHKKTSQTFGDVIEEKRGYRFGADSADDRTRFDKGILVSMVFKNLAFEMQYGAENLYPKARSTSNTKLLSRVFNIQYHIPMEMILRKKK